MFKSLQARLCLFMAVAMLCAMSLFNFSPPGDVRPGPAAEGIGIIKGIDTMSEDAGVAAVTTDTVKLASTSETSSSRLWTTPSQLDMMTASTSTTAGHQAAYPDHRLRGQDLSDLHATMTFINSDHGFGAESKPGGRLRPSTDLISNTSST